MRTPRKRHVWEQGRTVYVAAKPNNTRVRVRFTGINILMIEKQGIEFIRSLVIEPKKYGKMERKNNALFQERTYIGEQMDSQWGRVSLIDTRGRINRDVDIDFYHDTLNAFLDDKKGPRNE